MFERSHVSAVRWAVLTPGIRKVETLPALLDEAQIVTKRFWQPSPADCAAVLAWGRKPSAKAAQRYAKANAVPVIQLEDGFLRSVGASDKCPPLSIVLDDLGIYYDAESASRLESLIKLPLNSPEVTRAERVQALWCNLGLSKYNQRARRNLGLPSNYVLVADQTAGDLSIRFGKACPDSFQRMLSAALADNPNSPIVLKVHPDVVRGARKGHFDLDSLRRGGRVTVLSENVEPSRLIAGAAAIYVVTSQLGFEALLWNKPVHVFGMPFYAGWGLTHDEQTPPGRRHSVSLTQLVHAALIRYPRYLNPETGKRCEVEELMDWMALQARTRGSRPAVAQAYGFSAWKKPLVRQFLGGTSLRFYRWPAKPRGDGALVVWGRRHDARLQLESAGRPLLRLEDGFIRSIGLGAAKVTPLSWVVDDQGIYYDATKPSRLEQLLLEGVSNPALLGRARSLRKRLCDSGVTKYNLEPQSLWKRPVDAGRVCLVVGQVESDASIALGVGVGGLRSNVELLLKVRALCPKDYLVYKPHPDVTARMRKAGACEQKAHEICDEVIGEVSVNSLLEQVDEVHVLTSLFGFEALLRGVPVVTHGQPFYAGWGLTRDLGLTECTRARRSRRLGIDELVAAALICYPTYVHPRSRTYTTVEGALDWLLEARAAMPAMRQPSRSRAFLNRWFWYL